MKSKFYTIVTLSGLIQLYSSGIYASTAIDTMFNSYKEQKVTEFDAKVGQQLWNQNFTSNKAGQSRSCASCHTSDPAIAGKHAKTGKLIKPMAPSINTERLTDVKQMQKWFSRNCKWTMGRECSPQEQGDVLMYLKNL